MATTASEVDSSRQASISSFSRKGLPTWTAGRRSSLSESSPAEAKLAPWMPSRPVAAPTSMSALPTPAARASVISSCRATPTHMALTSGLPLKPGSKAISPATSGMPMQLP